MTKSDKQGQISGTFQVPANVPVGTKLVQFIGDKGSYGEATYTSLGSITTEDRRRITTITDTRRDETTIITKRYDPLAQTFVLNESRHIAGVDLWFSHAGSKRVTVQIREVSIGMPTANVLAEGYIKSTDINITSFTRIKFNPIWLEAGYEYAIVILTDDPETSVKIAELGKYDAMHATWVTSQAYQIGVLLSSSNASSWTAHQECDLTFRLLAAKFSEDTRIIDLGEIEADNISDLILLANVERIASDTLCEFSLTDTEGYEHKLADDLPIALKSRINGHLTAKAILRGSKKHSPVLYPGVQMVLGDLQETADYITRAIQAGSNTKVSVTYEAYLPGTADVKAYVLLENNEWILVELTQGKPIGESLIERTHILHNFNAESTRIKLVLSGNISYRPKVKNLRVVIV